MVHKPKHKVHSFRGLLSDGGQDEINLERQNVNLAYRVVKLNIIAQLPGTLGGQESTIMVWREEQTSISTTTATIDFSNPDLLGVAYWNASDSPQYAQSITVLFDNVLFSRNLYITHTDTHSSPGNNNCNYYIELEEVPVNASTLMQLKLGVARKLNLEQ